MASRSIENVDPYMRSISGYSLIPVERENELAALIHGEDTIAAEAALNELVCANLKLVVKIAHDFSRYRLGFQDLVSEGNVGLLKAARKFDPSKGAKFSVYAGWWIKQAMRKAIADKTRTIRLPTEQAKCKVALERHRAQLVSETGEDPTDEQLSAASGIPMRRIDMLNRSVTETVSMDELVADGADTSFLALMSMRDESDVTERMEARSLGLSAVMRALSDADRLLLEMRFGLHGKSRTSQETAQELGITYQDVESRLPVLLCSVRSSLLDMGIA